MPKIHEMYHAIKVKCSKRNKTEESWNTSQLLNFAYIKHKIRRGHLVRWTVFENNNLVLARNKMNNSRLVNKYVSGWVCAVGKPTGYTQPWWESPTPSHSWPILPLTLSPSTPSSHSAAASSTGAVPWLGLRMACALSRSVDRRLLE